MEEEKREEDIFRDIEALVKSVGCELVELTVSRHRGSSQVRAIIYSAAGTGIDECSAVHRLIFPRLQVLLDDPEPAMEVSSPGTDRWLKSDREYRIFIGRGVRLYSRERSDWVCGILEAFDGQTVTVRSGATPVALPLGDIAKARLDDSQEVR